jgi:DNA-binding beta-propeller fold protein YncE
LPVPADASVQLALDLDENAVLSTEADFSRRNASSAPLTVYALTVEPSVTTLAAAPRDTPETLLRPVHESAVKPLAVEALWSASLPVTSARAMAPQIAVDPTGRLWAIDGAANRLLIVAPDGASVETWGEPGAGAGQFAFRRDDGEVVGGIAFTPDGGFYVADSQNARIQQFAPDRTFVRAWGEPGEGDGQFVEPSGVSVAPDGEVYVIDDRRDDVQVFAPDGAFLRAFGGPGAADGQFDQPIAGAFAADGAYWLADTGNGRLQQFAAAGDHRLTVASRGRLQGVLDQPQAIAADGEGRIYVADRASRRIQVFDRDGAWVITLGDSAVGEAAFGDPIGVATDAAGDVYVLDVAGGKPALKKSRLVAA